MINRLVVAALISAPLVIAPAALASPGVNHLASASGAVASKASMKKCTSKNLLHSLEDGSTMKKYHCAYAGNEKWAAVLLKQGPTLYFEKYIPKGKHWNVYMPSQICGTASAGMPASILDYCKYA